MTHLIRAGGLNPGFGDQGGVNLKHTGQESLLRAIASTDDGVLVLSASPGVFGYWLTKFTLRGELDKRFGNQGFFHSNDSIGRNLHVLNDGEFLVVDGVDTTLVFTKYLADGELDTSYGEGGRVRFPVENLNITLSGQVGKYIGVGTLENTSKILPSTLSDDALPEPVGKVLSVMDDEHIYIVLSLLWGGDNDVTPVVIRFDVRGALDLTFNGSGYVVVKHSDGDKGYSVLKDAALQVNSGHKAILVLVKPISNLHEPQPQGDHLVLRFNHDGTQDYAFGGLSSKNNGIRIKYDDFEFPWKLVVDETGQLKVLGHGMGETAPNSTSVIQAYDQDGSIDIDFNEGVPLERDLAPGWGIWVDGASRGRDEKYQLITCAINMGELLMYSGRILQTGKFDDSFASNGLQTIETQYSRWSGASTMTLHKNGDILLGHHDYIYWLLG